MFIKKYIHAIIHFLYYWVSEVHTNYVAYKDFFYTKQNTKLNMIGCVIFPLACLPTSPSLDLIHVCFGFHGYMSDFSILQSRSALKSFWPIGWFYGSMDLALERRDSLEPPSLPVPQPVNLNTSFCASIPTQWTRHFIKTSSSNISRTIYLFIHQVWIQLLRMETSGNSSKKQKLSNAPESWVSGWILRDVLHY